MNDLYQRLHIENGASQAEIRRAYHKLAMRYHPDRNLGDKIAENEFKTIASAFEVLGDPAARALYDHGRIDDQGRPRPGYANIRDRFNWSDSDFNWSSPPSSDEPSAKTSSSSKDNLGTAADDVSSEKQYRLTINFVEACLGTTKHVRLPNKTQFKITIPAGVASGQKLRVKGAGENGKPFVVKVTVEPHRVFRLEGDDVHMEVPITPYECYYGVDLDMPTIHGPGKVTIPVQVTDGTVIRMPNMGLRRAKGVSGDQLLTVRVVMPDEFAPEVRFAMADWRQRAPFNPRRIIMSLLS